MLLLASGGCEVLLERRAAAIPRTKPGRHVGPSRTPRSHSRPAPRLSLPPAPLRSREPVDCPFAPTLGTAGGLPRETGRRSHSQGRCVSDPRSLRAFLLHRPETAAWPASVDRRTTGAGLPPARRAGRLPARGAVPPRARSLRRPQQASLYWPTTGSLRGRTR